MVGDITLARWILIAVLSGAGLALPVSAGDHGSDSAFDVAPTGPRPAPDRPEETRLGGSSATVDDLEIPTPPAVRVARSRHASVGTRPGVRSRIDRPPRPSSPAFL